MKNNVIFFAAICAISALSLLSCKKHKDDKKEEVKLPTESRIILHTNAVMQQSATTDPEMHLKVEKILAGGTSLPSPDSAVFKDSYVYVNFGNFRPKDAVLVIPNVLSLPNIGSLKPVDPWNNLRSDTASGSTIGVAFFWNGTPVTTIQVNYVVAKSSYSNTAAPVVKSPAYAIYCTDKK